MREVRLWRRVFGLGDDTVIEAVEWDAERDAFIVSVRPRRNAKTCCGECGAPAPGYDQGEGRREWRAMDVGEVKAYLEGGAPRVNCAVHGATVAAVPWARHGSRQARRFEDQVAWLAVHTSKSAVVALMRVAWRTVGSVVARVVAEGQAARDPFDGLRRIGIDEISYKRGHRYLMVVVDHDTGRLVWAAAGHDSKTLAQFFDMLGDERCAQVRLVSADALGWMCDLIRARCPRATLCTDPFHVVAWATDALDKVRREVWNDARRSGQRALAKDLKGARFALWKNPQDLTDRQGAKLAWIAATNKRLYRAYLLKEQLRQVFALKGNAGVELLRQWLAWASRSKIAPFVDLARRIRNNLAGIHAALTEELSNALVESTNTKLRVLTRIAYGFANPDHLIALALLDRGGFCPPLPGRAAA